MSLEGIDVFVEVVNAQSFTRAAGRLGMPTTTVSSKIAKLEERLGVTLIQRTTRQLHVTPAGRTYYDHCVRALAEISEGEDALASITCEPSGPLRLTAPPDLAQTVLSPIVEDFLRRYPKTSLELIITNAYLNLIADGIDLAVRIGPLEDSTLVVRKFRAGRMALWASPTYLARKGTPSWPEDLRGHDFIRLSPMGQRVSLKNDAGYAIEIDFLGRLASNDMDNLKEFIVRGNGIGLLPDFVGSGAAVPTLTRVLPEFASDVVTAYFAYPAQRFVPLVVQAFIAVASEQVRAGSAGERA